MRNAAWAAATIGGGWLATTVSYALIGAVVAAAWAQDRGDDGGSTADTGTITPTDVIAAVAVIAVVALVTWLSARILDNRAVLAPRPTAVVAAAGPLGGVATTLAVFLANGGIPWAALAHGAAAALGVAAGLYAGAGQRPVRW